MELLERELYLDALDSGFSMASSGAGCIALVSGEAGIGKTSLIQQFVSGQRHTARALWGGCAALFTPQPLAPLYDIARQIGGQFAAAIMAATNRASMFNAAVELLQCSSAPTIVVIEDAHWADEATLDLVKYLGRRIQRLDVMLVLSFRDDEVGAHHALRSVIGDLPDAVVRRVPLPPLTEAAVTTLAGRTSRCDSRLYEITGGNPFFLSEILAASDNTVPVSVRDAVLARIARLSDAARDIAYVVALVPGGTERWLLQAVVGPDGRGLEECLGAGMIARGDSIAFRHELARQAVEDHVSLPVRQDVHARILAALLGHGGADIQLARIIHHADRAGDSSAVLRFAPDAAEQAASLGAHRESASYFAIALRHGPALSRDAKAALLDRLAYEYQLTDQIGEAIQSREAALALWKSAGCQAKEGDDLRWLSRLFWCCANRAAAERYAAEAVNVLESLAPGRELAMAYSNLAQLGMVASESGEATLWGNKALSIAVALGDAEIESHALNNVGTAKLNQSDHGGLSDLERSLELALAGGFHEHAARAYANLASTTVRQRDFDRLNGYLRDGIAYCEERDLDSEMRYMIACRAEANLAQGNWQHASSDAEAILSCATVPPVTKVPALVVLARVRARRGDPGVEPLFEEAYRLALASGELQRIGLVVSARAEAAWLRDDLPSMVEEVNCNYERACKQATPWLKEELAFWLWRAGCVAVAPEGIAIPFAVQIAGDWNRAACAWEALGCPYEQATALLDSDAEGALRRALTIFVRLGAVPMADNTRRKLRAVGIHGFPRGAQQRTKKNPCGLTARELQVVSLLAERRRNAEIARRLFVAEKTVEHHVSAVLAKLQVRSRSEAVAVARQLGLCAVECSEWRTTKS